MSSKESSKDRNRVNKRGAPRRRKIALACETCREKKVRCDGAKPICGPCSQRSYSIDRCVYKIENARSASNDAYLKVLHDRIRELEQVCAQNGVATPAPAASQLIEGETEPTSDINESRPKNSDLDPESRASVAAEGLLGLGSHVSVSRPFLTPAPQGTTPCLQTYQSPVRSSQPGARDPGSSLENSRHRGSVQFLPAHMYSSPSNSNPNTNSRGSVTAMGSISVADDGECADSPREQYYGKSSAASFMRLARDSVPIRSYLQALKKVDYETPNTLNRDTGLWQDINTTATPSGFHIDDFSLPPRPLADHLLECYWERIYCLYPFFHRPSFERAYENLWGSVKWPKPNLPDLNIGLGGSFDSGPQSIIFHTALNAIFALSCHFSDIPAGEREAAAYSFFLRAKRFIGLDFLDTDTIGVVQTFLIVALLLQSTPYTNRCWNAIGLACRVAQGLGLHETTTPKSITPLEKEIRRRTWHGCVMMDMILSMTYGRPSMTSHISPVHPVPLPAMRPQSQAEDPCALSGQPCDHKLGHITFYASTIELYKILESILADVYNAWQGQSDHHRTISIQGTRQNSLDVIMELDDRLSAYETNISPVLNWTTPQQYFSPENHPQPVLQRQQNVLRARFIHLRLLLYRPMFTQLCSEERMDLTRQNGSDRSASAARLGKNDIYTSMSVNCATSCVNAAIELVSLVYETYRTSLTDAWWYNGFYTSTAGFVLIMSYSCSSILKKIDAHLIAETWRKCEKILTHMASFSLSARNSLQFLQVTHHHIVQNYTSMSAPSFDLRNGYSLAFNPAVSHNEGNGSLGPDHAQSQQRMNTQSEISPRTNEVLPEELGLRDMDHTSGLGINPLTSWDEIGLGQEEFGFLGRFDVPDIASWFPDLPDPSLPT
ncbi:hypothetical protein N7466_009286 [Penicillium verhagenii]|uniref:uncharacterized protein n=1 Tax=Penicillium verhagenii TaxID=1562060 RepID=UPI0025451768|nr:uncharacterized protein N7466_009286 [Penicillium verhagenii]KAJ5920960.1 hypothetical protein N7466_009286 [Penicillium verhagenii]